MKAQVSSVHSFIFFIMFFVLFSSESESESESLPLPSREMVIFGILSSLLPEGPNDPTRRCFLLGLGRRLAMLLCFFILDRVVFLPAEVK